MRSFICIPRDIPKPSSESASRRMSATGQRDTSAELSIRCRLHALGLRYRVNHPVSSRPRRTADIVFTKVRLAVFVDGCFWHGCPDHGTWPKSNAEFWKQKIEANRIRDKETDDLLKAKEWTVIRVWEHEDPEVVVRRIARVYRHLKAEFPPGTSACVKSNG